MQMRAILLAFGLLIIAAPVASACECMPPSHSKAFRKAAAVFVGEVVDISDSDVPIVEGANYSVAVKFKVIEYWKGRVGTEITVHTEQGVMSCNEYKFQKGEKYLVYARGKNLTVFTGCSRSAPLSSAAYVNEELKRLGKSKKPNPKINSLRD
jgi:hypothetical protein